MVFHRFSFVLIAFLLLFPVSSVHAESFGITPSVFAVQAQRGERIEGSVSIVRSNPKQDTYVLVSARDNSTGAIILTSGTRFLLPLGEDHVTYSFSIDTSRVGEGDSFEGGIEFLSEKTDKTLQGTDIQLGGVMKVEVSFGSPQDATVSVETNMEAENNGRDGFEGHSLFVLLAALLFVLSMALWKRRQESPRIGWVFLLTSVAFVLAVAGWVFTSGRITIHRWTDTWQIDWQIRDGSFFLLTEAGEADLFLNAGLGVSQEINGEWSYTAPTPGRVYIIPATTQTREEYENRLFLFYEDAIKPFGAASLPGLVDAVQENARGTYAVFRGIREEDDSVYWCVAEVWDALDLACDFLDTHVRDEILFTSFSAQEPNIIYFQTATSSYAYDIWRKTLQRREESLSTPAALFEFVRPLETEAVKTRLGFVHLDESWVWAPGPRSYYFLAPNVWIERLVSETGEQISIVNTYSFKRFFLTGMSPEQQLYWLQNGGFITNP